MCKTDYSLPKPAEDVKDMDFSEVELRVLAHMREDAEKMDDTDSFRRPDDLEGYDTAKVRTLLSLKNAQRILKTGGVVNLPDIHKSKAAELFEISEEAVNKAQRQFAKNYTYMELYGCRETFAEYLEREGLPPPIGERMKS